MWPNLQFPADLVPFTEEILTRKLYFLWSVGQGLLTKVSWKNTPNVYGELIDFSWYSSQTIFLPSPIHSCHKLTVIVKLVETVLFKFLGTITLISYYKKPFLGYKSLGNAFWRQVKRNEEMLGTIWYPLNSRC